jgi:hypothetical protein
MAMARVDDVEYTVRLADEMVADDDQRGAVCLLQCGKPSTVAAELRQELTRLGRRVVPLLIKDREQAQSDDMLAKLTGASAVWVFSDDLLETYLSLFATQLAFELRSKAKAGLPVIGIGNGALSLGGLLLATRICGDAQYDLVSGLGWAPRVMVDSGVDRDEKDADIARSSVRALPGLLGVDLRQCGGIRVEGGRVESVGSEAILLIGGDSAENSSLQTLEIRPGQFTSIAPPPFAPFERGMLPPATLQALIEDVRPFKVSPDGLGQERSVEPNIKSTPDRDEHAKPGSGQPCPMCKQIHAAEPKLLKVAA